MNKKFIKLTFTGDLMFKREQLEAITRTRRAYDDIFEKVKPLFDESDFVVGNLETPVAGEELGLVSKPAVFNAPDEFAVAIKNAGFDMVTTANNHCLDRGVRGIDETLRRLDRIGLKHTGTYSTKEKSESLFIEEISGVKIAFIGMTYGTNSEYGRQVLGVEDLWRIDFTKKQETQPGKATVRRTFKERVVELIPNRILKSLLVLKHGDKIFTRPFPDFTTDNVPPQAIDDMVNVDIFSRQLSKVKAAKNLADLVVVMPHVGGQYNPSPGRYEKYVVKELVKAGADIVVANHSHNPLEFVTVGRGVPVAYSLGNFCTTPNADWFVPGSLGEYSVMLNVYIDSHLKRLYKCTCTIVKNITDTDGFSYTVPACFALPRDAVAQERFESELAAVVRRFAGGVRFDLDLRENEIWRC